MNSFPYVPCVCAFGASCNLNALVSSVCQNRFVERESETSRACCAGETKARCKKKEDGSHACQSLKNFILEIIQTVYIHTEMRSFVFPKGL